MENSSQPEQQLVRIQLEDNFKPVSAITDEYKILNKNLLEYISIFEKIFQQQNVHLNDYKRLTEMKIEFNSYEFDHPLYIIYGFNIKSNILNATLIETYIKAHEFFRNQFCGLWYNQMEIYKIKLIELGTKIDSMLMLLEILYVTLDSIQMDFNSVIKEIDLLNDYVYDTFDFKFKFENYTKLSSNYHDLNTQKIVFIKAIRDAKMHKIEKTLSEKDEIDYQIFIQKCIETIKVIEFEMMAHQTPIDQMIKHLDINNTSINQKIEEEINAYQEIEVETTNNPIEIEQVPTKLEKENNNLPKTEIKNIKPFPDYLLHTQKEKLAEGLKNQFSVGKGKKIRTMIEGLKQTTPPLITLSTGDNQAFHTALSQYFNRNIGTYSSIFQCDFDKSSEQPNINNAIIEIDHVITTL